MVFNIFLRFRFALWKYNIDIVEKPAKTQAIPYPAIASHLIGAACS